jgi:parallel beta-helix repeat protein
MVIVSVSLVTLMFVPASAGRAAVKCAVTVPPGGDIQTALDSAPASSTICVSSGTYTISATLVPKLGQTILGLKGAPMPVIMCPPPIIFCIDGSLGPSKVKLSELVFDGARAGDIRTGIGWKLSHIEARNAGIGGSTSGVGILVNGSNVAITDSYVHDNWQFGIRAVNAANLTIKTTEVAFNPKNPTADPGFSGGVKVNGVNGVIAKKNYVHNNGGVAGLWLDVDTLNFQLVGNRVVDNTGDEIRVETSCYGTLESNIVSGGSNAGIDLFNAHDVTVISNIVASPATALFGVRMLNNGRTATVGTGACLIDGAYQNVNNQAVSNSITLADPATIVGIDSNGGIAANDTWSGDVFTVPDCNGLQWQWWDGAVEQRVNFPGWQTFGQDLIGSCASTAPPPLVSSRHG